MSTEDIKPEERLSKSLKNFRNWRIAYILRARRKFGRNAPEYLNTGEYPDLSFERFNNRNLSKKDEIELKELRNRQDAIDNEKPKVFADLIYVLLPDSKYLIENHPEFTDINLNGDPLLLFGLIERVHALTEIESQMLIKEYRTTLFNMSQDLTDFNEYSIKYANIIKELRLLRFEFDQYQCSLDFISSLNADIFQTQIERLHMENKIPNNFESARELFSKYWNNFRLKSSKNEDNAQEITNSIKTNVTNPIANNPSIQTQNKHCDVCELLELPFSNNHETKSCFQLKKLIKLYKSSKKNNANRTNGIKINNDLEMNYTFSVKLSETDKKHKGGFFLDTCTSLSITNGHIEYERMRKTRALTVNGFDEEKSATTTDTILQHKLFGEMYLVKSSWTNLIAFNQLKNRSDHTEYSLSNDSFIFIIDKNTEVTFSWDVETRLYKLVDIKKVQNYSTNLVNIVPTEKQKRIIQHVQMVHEQLGHVHLDKLADMVENRLIKNLDVSRQQIGVYNAFGIECSVCKIINHKENIKVEGPKSLIVGELWHLDLLLIEHCNFLMLVEHVSSYIQIMVLIDKSVKSIESAISKHIAELSTINIKVTRLSSDYEKVFQNLKNFCDNRSIMLHLSAPNTHEKMCERYVQWLKLKVKMVKQSMNFECPTYLIQYLIQHCAKLINLLPNSKTKVSSFEILRRELPDAFKLSFGDVATYRGSLSKNEIGIYVGNEGNNLGVFFNVMTKKINVRFTYTKVNMDESLIKILKRNLEIDCHVNLSNIEIEEFIAKSVTPGINEENLVDKEANKPTVIVTSEQEQQEIKNVEDNDSSDDGNEIENNEIHSEDEEPTGYISRNYFSFQRTNSISVKEAIQSNNISMLKAIQDEIESLTSKNVFEYINQNNISHQEQIIGMHMILSEKLNASNEVIRSKARLVLLGNHINKDGDIIEYFSSTIKLETINLLFNLKIILNLKLEIWDVKTAYINAPINERVVVIFPTNLVQQMQKIDPNCRKFVNNNKLYAILKKALYGHPASAKLWHNLLLEILKRIGFQISNFDSSLLFKRSNGKLLLLAIYVDDILVLYDCKIMLEETSSQLEEKFGKLTKQIENENTEVEYLGTKVILNAKENSIQMSQPGMIKEVLEELNITKSVECPSDSRIIHKDDSNLLDDKEKKLYRSIVMKLQYIARKTRGDILFPVNVLSTRFESPSNTDFNHLIRIGKYLFGTKSLRTTLKPINMKLTGYCDSSYNLFDNGSCQGGYTIRFGNSQIVNRSFRHKYTPISSAEAELYSISECGSHLIWIYRLLTDLEIKIESPILYTDNKSAIWFTKEGSGNFSRTKHIRPRAFLVKEWIDSGEMKIEYVQTESNFSDLFTKHIHGEKFCVFRDKILGNN